MLMLRMVMMKRQRRRRRHGVMLRMLSDIAIGPQRFVSSVGAHRLRTARSCRLDPFHFVLILVQLLFRLFFVNGLSLERCHDALSWKRRRRLLRWARSARCLRCRFRRTGGRSCR